jgi:hypothetical protein
MPREVNTRPQAHQAPFHSMQLCQYLAPGRQRGGTIRWPQRPTTNWPKQLPAAALSLPSVYILSNSSANNKAPAECALAVCVANGCPNCSQLERPLHNLGHVLYACNQHVQQQRVQGRVLQQRRLPPALGAKYMSHSVDDAVRMSNRRSSCRNVTVT